MYNKHKKVKTMSKSNPVSATEVVDNVEITETQVFQPEKMSYDFDSSLFAEEYFAPIEETLPYAISDATGRILIPETEVEKAEWFDPPTEYDQFDIKGGDKFNALAYSEIHVSILKKDGPFWYYAKTDANEANKLVNQPVCWYNSAQGQEVKVEFDNAPANDRPYNYAIKLQIVLLDSDLAPMHQVPLSLKFRGTACWNVLTELRKFYTSCDKLFAAMNGHPRTAFDHRVHALFAPKIVFGSESVGKKYKSPSIRIKEITKPTKENVAEWCLAVNSERARNEMLWVMQQDYAAADANKLPAPIASLPASPTPTASALTGETDLPQLAPSDPNEDFENGKLF
jgi:hypothetical protein